MTLPFYEQYIQEKSAQSHQVLNAVENGAAESEEESETIDDDENAVSLKLNMKGDIVTISIRKVRIVPVDFC